MNKASIRQARYDEKNTYRFNMKLNIKTDEDIIKWLDGQKSKQGAIKDLIRDKIERER